MTRVAVITSVIPSYRRGLFKRLFSHQSISVSVFCQTHVPDVNLDLIHNEFPGHINLVSFWSMPRERLGWQFLPILKLWKSYDVFVFNSNPRVLSNVLWATLFRLFGRSVIIWGQAHTAGANRYTEALRLFWAKFFHNHLVYTDQEAELLRARGFRRHKIIGMNNGLDQDEIELMRKQWNDEQLLPWMKEHQLTGKTIILSCARLEKKNDFHLMVEAMPEMVKEIPSLVWVVIGDGREREKLMQLAQRNGVEGHIIFLGEIYKEEELAPWFMSAVLLVHPGAIGLTLMHAFGYGLPVITHDDLRYQMPEISALEHGKNGLLFRRGDVASLVAVIMEVLDDRERLFSLSTAALNVVVEKYNTREMAQRFSQLVEYAMHR